MNNDHVAGNPVDDAGRRLADAVTLALSLGGTDRWVAARLSDGGTDGNVYDTRQDAIRHQLHEDQCCYVLIPPTGMPPAEATAYLSFNRRRVAAGLKMVDPESQAPPPLMTPIYELTNRAARRANGRRR